jgi:hypothetical protein
MAEFHSARDIPLLAMRKAAGSGSGPRSISYNEAERSLIAFSDADGGKIRFVYIQSHNFVPDV